MMKLNCDLGEGQGDIDEQVMPYIDMANIACGGHAGDKHTMRHCVALAHQHGVVIGAHPSYPDKQHKGRKSLILSKQALQSSIIQQLEQLQAVCEIQRCAFAFIKPHGALYNDMMQQEPILETLLEVCAKQYPGLPLVIQGTVCNQSYATLAHSFSVPLLFEGFADRLYTDTGFLVDRSNPKAVHNTTIDIVTQANNFIRNAGVNSESGQWLDIAIDTLCVHGDTPLAFESLRSIRQQLV